MSNALLLAVLYFLVSLIVFVIFFKISRNISGVNFSAGWFWFFLIWVMLWGMIQLDVARNGYILFIPVSKVIIEDNYLIRWVAFISSILQVFCLPGKEKPRGWFPRK